MIPGGDYQHFLNAIRQEIAAERVFTDPLHTLAYGTDASFYRLVPKIVIKAIDEAEVVTILKEASARNLSVTFRAAGTSLSGQAISDSILVICSFGFRGVEILEDAKAIKLQPGVIGSTANGALRFFNRKIGPDPASINAAQIGGIIANNASGMCCGIDQNSYKTLKDIRILFVDGTILDTSLTESIDAFRQKRGELIEEIETLTQVIQADRTLYEQIQRKYSIKNTTGYALNALIDFDDPIDKIAHLMVGSEGTLGFISSVTLHTVKEPLFKASSLILFENIYEACRFVAALKTDGSLVNAAELMDRASLRSVENKEGVDPKYKRLDDAVASILVECGAEDHDALLSKIASLKQLADAYRLVEDITFFEQPQEYERLWALRKGTFPTVGAMRQSGTTTIIEDVAFRVEDLADGIVELQALFKRYGYHEAIIFGHALEGNIHFVFNQDFETEQEIKRYESFMEDVCRMVALKYQGSLKAEHGTGRNMAPFVEMEWGESAYALMRQIKNIFDKHNLLNPGVIINNDPKIHLKNLKLMTAFHPVADKCIECGFCEPICPSKDLTLTPRQRIAVNREIARQKIEKTDYRKLLKHYRYAGEETCAVDGLCATSCPVGINTGTLTKDIRAQQYKTLARQIAQFIARHYGSILFMLRQSFKVLNLLESLITPQGMRVIRKIIPPFPFWYDSMPRVTTSQEHAPSGEYERKVVYFSSCIHRAFGTQKQAEDSRDIRQVVESLCNKAHLGLIYPDNEHELCCGVPFESKGFQDQADQKLNQLMAHLDAISNHGEYPILCDNSPCSYRMRQHLPSTHLKIYEPIEFALTLLVPHLTIIPTDEPIALHTTCSSKKMQLDQKFHQLASLLSNDVVVPEKINCCGFAGDRGFHFPQLNESALSNLKEQLKPTIRRGFSTSKTCEIGLSHHSERTYHSILYLLDQCSHENHLGPQFGAKPQNTQLTHVPLGVVPCAASRFLSTLRWAHGYQP
jgi:D-lactate dehydrogenase